MGSMMGAMGGGGGEGGGMGGGALGKAGNNGQGMATESVMGMDIPDFMGNLQQTSKAELYNKPYNDALAATNAEQPKANAVGAGGKSSLEGTSDLVSALSKALGNSGQGGAEGSMGDLTTMMNQWGTQNPMQKANISTYGDNGLPKTNMGLNLQ